MTEQTEIVPIESLRLGALVVSPDDVIIRATAIATALAAIIKSRKLYSTISGKNFTRCEGWTTMGAMLGLLPREDGVIRNEDGSFEATVSIIRTSDGAVVGRASAIVGMDESTWSKRPEYARRSMAVTRATGKAFRLGFSWIMTLAGYEPTPAEEIPEEPIDAHFTDASAQPSTPAKPKSNGKAFNPAQALVDWGIAEKVPEASAILNKSPWVKGGMTADDLQKWGKLYRGWRDTGKEPDEAAEKATAGEQPA